MVTQISDIPNLEKQISGLNSDVGYYKDKLNNSSTALGGSGTPTFSDISTQQSLDATKKQIQGLTDEKLRAQWYTPKVQASPQLTTGEEPTKKGFIGSALDYLSRPLYGVVGAVKHATGQGSDSLQKDIADNMVRNKNTFSDVLKTAGVPWMVAAPVGFMMDMAGDPVAWATMGGGSILPRLGIGAYKGFKTGEGIGRGLAVAAKSDLLGTANTIGKYTPFFRKSEAFKKLGEKALRSVDEYEMLTGNTAADIVSKTGIAGTKFKLGDAVNGIANAVPGGEKFLQNFIYDPASWVRKAHAKDIFQESLGANADISGAINAYKKGESIEPFLQSGKAEVLKTLEETPVGTMDMFADAGLDGNTAAYTKEALDSATAKLKGVGAAPKISMEAAPMVDEVDDAFSILNNPHAYTSDNNPVEIALRLTQQKVGGSFTLEDMADIVNSGALDASGVKWFDNMMKGIRDFGSKLDANGERIAGIGQKTMNLYDQALGVFRVAKVGASPTGHVNAIAGDLVMTHMYGDLTPGYISRLKLVNDVFGNKPGAAKKLSELLTDAGGEANTIINSMVEAPSAYRGTFGSLGFVGAQYQADAIIQAARGEGLISSAIKNADVKAEFDDAIQKVMKLHDNELGTVVSTLPDAQKLGLTGMDAGTSRVRDFLEKGKALNRADVGTGMMGNELFEKQASQKMFALIAKKAKEEPSNYGWKLLDFTFNKMSSQYETYDQKFKLTSFIRSTVDGYTVDQLQQMRSIVNIAPEEIELLKYIKDKKTGEMVRFIKDGEYRYRLAPKTALELANVAYLNYAAMPAAVKVMRNFPLLGSPFVSFMYGMSLKTGQTLAYNPAAFNKVTFALNDFGGTKNPLEKKALDSEYYSYLKQPGMFRTPFFDEHPIYLNLSSMIPYYSLNMFNPTKTSYGNSVREKVAQTFQSSPIMKDPFGSNLFDFLILPLILGEGIRPQGQFGQPLYPVDATMVEKAGYGARNLTEAFVPNVAAYAGLAGGLVAPGITPYVSLYRYRELANAMKGKNQLGISGKEAPSSRTLRTLLKTSGIPVQAPVNTTFNQAQQ